MSTENIVLEKYNWPPTEKQINNIALSALNQSDQKKIKVLVYWENNPNLMIFDPIHFADTKYITKGFKTKDGEREVIVHIGKID
jgi:hypothetical protein